MGICLLYDPIFMEHRTGPAHPERPERLRLTLEYLEREGYLSRVNLLAPRAATRDELALVHTVQHIEAVAQMAASGGGNLDPDTVVSERSYEAACLAAGAVLRALDEIWRRGCRRAFCLVRPPGHHATPRRAMGFCLFNNLAIGVRYARQAHGVKRLAIVDWDAHHGNGLQEIFYADPDVLYISLHQYPLYPGSGHRTERGEGAGVGATLNIPLPPGSGDGHYLRAFEQEALPALRDFRPELVLVAAGFDGHRRDPLTNLDLTEEGYREMARLLCGVADEFCEGRIVFSLEGGYNLLVLPRSIARVLDAMLEGEAPANRSGTKDKGTTSQREAGPAIGKEKASAKIKAPRETSREPRDKQRLGEQETLPGME